MRRHRYNRYGLPAVLLRVFDKGIQMGPERRENGRDEMNIAEFPLGVLADRVPSGCKTLNYESQHGKLTITGSDAYGLPTAPDTDVLLGLVQLTKLHTNFTLATVPFTRLEVLNLIGWPNRGQYYRRLDDSLNRWVGTTLHYIGTWWDNSIKCRVDARFHILDDVTIFDDQAKRTLRSRQQPLPLSTFTWGRKFFESCRADNLKRLDLGVYFGLRSAVSRQLYRFLDKRFYQKADLTFELPVLAFEHVGLSRNYTAAKVKEKLNPALEELEGVGFLQPMTNADRYVSVSRGRWRIRLVRKHVS
jgi:plasmid replication initiation protein